MNLAAPSPVVAEEVARLARVLRAAPVAVAGALGLPLGETEGAAEVAQTDALGGVVVLWDGPVGEILGDASGVAEYTIQGTAHVSARTVGTGDMDTLCAALLIGAFALRAQGVAPVAGENARLSFAAPLVFYPAGEARDTVRLQIPLALTILLQVLDLPEDATLTESSATLISPPQWRQG